MPSSSLLPTSIKLSALLTIISLGAGCTSYRSPTNLPPTTTRTGFGEGATLGLSTMAGAAAGYAVRNDALGAAVGAGTGIVAGALINNALSVRAQQRDAELVEAARREERVKMQTEYWEAERMEKQGSQTGRIGISERSISYGGGYFEGVNVAPHHGVGASTLGEPKRP